MITECHPGIWCDPRTGEFTATDPAGINLATHKIESEEYIPLSAAEIASDNLNDYIAALTAKLTEINDNTQNATFMAECPPGSGIQRRITRDVIDILVHLMNAEDVAGDIPISFELPDSQGPVFMENQQDLIDFYNDIYGVVADFVKAGEDLKALVYAASTASEIMAVEDNR